ncbi:hypothetical protein EB796_024771 [Bugula neritina]|uniref:Uncharacterized protein n=1 Tax=Bugula neritina TaxID=10212 RepID=A0A7J7ITJ3_BUGNE|nr:hypothetical protein EB796_025150 [Bugula neritina]KAF6016931.1 hypothetical protein EB796_024771 [Bugula neritina]
MSRTLVGFRDLEKHANVTAFTSAEVWREFESLTISCFMWGLVAPTTLHPNGVCTAYGSLAFGPATDFRGMRA